MKKSLDVKLKTAEFQNIHGERFYIHTNHVMVFMSGDEVNAMVDDKHKMKLNGQDMIHLFNPAFSIWSKDELNKLGRALMDLNK